MRKKILKSGMFFGKLQVKNSICNQLAKDRQTITISEADLAKKLNC
jgi:hypothetical protein